MHPVAFPSVLQQSTCRPHPALYVGPSILAHGSVDSLAKSFQLDVSNPVLSEHPFSIDQEKTGENRDGAIRAIGLSGPIRDGVSDVALLDITLAHRVVVIKAQNAVGVGSNNLETAR